jgi:hypothetical protein
MPGHSKSRAGVAARTGGPPGGVRRGNGAGHGGPAKGVGKGPARGYTWEQATEGNELSVVHGASSARFYGPVAEGLRDQLFALPSCPGYLRDPLWAFALRGWAEAEAQCLLGQEYLSSLTFEEQFTAKKQGQTAPIEIVQKLEKHAANMRDKVGLNPSSAARLGKSLAATELDIAKLAEHFMTSEMGEDPGGDD